MYVEPFTEGQSVIAVGEDDADDEVDVDVPEEVEAAEVPVEEEVEDDGWEVPDVVVLDLN